jgi:hypothetical protein
MTTLARTALATLLVLPTLVVAQPDPCPDDVGAFIAERCPCTQKNHGQYVSCVVRERNALRKLGCLDREANRDIARCAARSTCGKEGRVVCCFVTSEGDCSDPVADGTAAGACSNDAELVCDTAADCTVFRARVARSETSCTDAGGQSAGSGSVCTACDALAAP